MVTYTTEITHVSITAASTVHIKIKFMIQLRSDQIATIQISIFRLSVSSIYTTKHLLDINSEIILAPYVTCTFTATIKKNSPLNCIANRLNPVSILRPYHSHRHFNIKSDVWLTVHRNSVWIRKTN